MPLTKNLPKTFLKIGNTAILDTQVKIYKNNNIQNINIGVNLMRLKNNPVNLKKEDIVHILKFGKNEY